MQMGEHSDAAIVSELKEYRPRFTIKRVTVMPRAGDEDNRDSLLLLARWVWALTGKNPACEGWRCDTTLPANWDDV